MGRPGHDDFRALDRLVDSIDVNTNCGRLILGCECRSLTANENTHHQHKQAHTYLRRAYVRSPAVALTPLNSREPLKARRMVGRVGRSVEVMGEVR